MSKQGKIRLFQWVLDLESPQQILFFSFFARELTVIFRAYRSDKKLSDALVIEGCSAINDIQQRILNRLLPTPKLDREQAEFIISEIERLAELNATLSSHFGSALHAAKRRTRDEASGKA